MNKEVVQGAIQVQKQLDERRFEFARQQDILLKEKLKKNEEVAKKMMAKSKL